ncbi:hypothetical protein ACSNOI_35820 [Actinomadura kijaniata]|uniref:hypothetical protein n=1 Tax=Actinomadura kijaniata TaxID=46161 RepID=UPI003F19FAB8
MTRILTRFLDGRVRAYLPEGEGPLEPVAAFPVAPGAEPCGHDAAPDLERAVYATRHEVVCVDRDGTERWRYDLLPRSTQRYGHAADCVFSHDGAVVWLYRPDAYAGRGGPDRWVVLDAAFHDDPGGKETLELAVEVFGHDPDEAERHHHYLVDLRTGGVVDRLGTHARTPYDLELPGDGSWVTSDGEGRPVRWTRR